MLVPVKTLTDPLSPSVPLNAKKKKKKKKLVKRKTREPAHMPESELDVHITDIDRKY